MINNKELEAIGVFSDNKKIKILHLIGISIVIFFVIVVAILNNISGNNSSSNIKETTSVNLTKATAVDYVCEHYENDIRSSVKSNGHIKSITSFNIANGSVHDYTDSKYYIVTLKGNCIGYWDDYNTKLTQVKFTSKVKIYYDGSWGSISTETQDVY